MTSPKRNAAQVFAHYRPRRQRRRSQPIFIASHPSSIDTPTPTPLEAVLIALDAAKRTGYATYIVGRLWDYGEVNAREPEQRRRVFADAIGAAYLRELPIGVVCEVPYGGFQSAARSLHGTYMAWCETWLGTGLPASHLLQRTASRWRREFGWHTLPREQARKLEALVADQVIARDLGARRLAKPAPGPDACAAICIGQTIVRSSELAQLLRCRARAR